MNGEAENLDLTARKKIQIDRRGNQVLITDSPGFSMDISGAVETIDVTEIISDKEWKEAQKKFKTYDIELSEGKVNLVSIKYNKKEDN